jgi:ketosteroid isomerase-like protein
MTASASTSAQEDIRATLMRWIEAVEGRDLGSLPEIVAQDSDLAWIGTDATEWASGYAGLERVMQAQNKALQDVRVAVSNEAIHFYPGANLAWATNRWAFRARSGDQDIDLPLRCTWILERRGLGWRIVHFHKSVGVSE